MNIDTFSDDYFAFVCKMKLFITFTHLEIKQTMRTFFPLYEFHIEKGAIKPIFIRQFNMALICKCKSFLMWHVTQNSLDIAIIGLNIIIFKILSICIEQGILSNTA